MPTREEIERLFGSKQYHACLQHCEATLENDSDSIFALKWAGKSLLSLGSTQQARGYLIKAHQRRPRDPEIIKDIGNCFLNEGSLEEAANAYQRCLDIKPDYAPAVYNLAGIAQISRDYKRAIELFKDAVEIDNSLKQARLQAASCALAINEWDYAVSLCNKAIEIDSNQKGAYQIKGDAHRSKGELREALEAYGQESLLTPHDTTVLIKAADVLHRIDRVEDAISLLLRVLELEPDSFIALSNLGCLLNHVDRHEEAASYCKRAIAYNAENTESYGNLAIALFGLGRLEDALAAINRAISLDPSKAAYHTYRGGIYMGQGRYQQATAEYEHALEIDPQFADARGGLSCIQLLKGNYSEGWRNYSCRPGKPSLQGIPIWDGRTGGQVLVLGEQGLGDQILYASMIREMQTSCKVVTLRIDTRLVSLFKRSFTGNIRVESMSEPPDRGEETCFNSYIALGDLGGLYRKSPTGFLNKNRGYLSADPALQDRLRKTLKLKTGKRIIGVSWKSLGSGYYSKSKSLSTIQLAKTLSLIDAHFICLQYGDCREEIKTLSDFGVQLDTFEDIDLKNDIEGLTALVSVCNAVITISNVTAHIAGAVGIETHVLVPQLANHYWGLSAPETPWYESARIYRQADTEDWTDALTEITKNLMSN